MGEIAGATARGVAQGVLGVAVTRRCGPSTPVRFSVKKQIPEFDLRKHFKRFQNRVEEAIEASPNQDAGIEVPNIGN
jgi:hypothetical protein